jgi:hypothetical protein
VSEAAGPPSKKHRHDLGQEDHGPVMAERTTRAIQGVLAVAIALTAGALVWAAIDAGSGPSTPKPVVTEAR